MSNISEVTSAAKSFNLPKVPPSRSTSPDSTAFLIASLYFFSSFGSLINSIGFIFLEGFLVVSTGAVLTSDAISATDPTPPASTSKLLSAIFLNLSYVCCAFGAILLYTHVENLDSSGL